MNNALTKYRTWSWYEATARERVANLLDRGSFTEFIGPEKREVSPHLALFDLPEAFGDGILVGRGTVQGREVLLAAQEGRFMGGTFGEVHGAKLVGLLPYARDHREAHDRRQDPSAARWRRRLRRGQHRQLSRCGHQSA